MLSLLLGLLLRKLYSYALIFLLYEVLTCIICTTCRNKTTPFDLFRFLFKLYMRGFYIPKSMMVRGIPSQLLRKSSLIFNRDCVYFVLNIFKLIFYFRLAEAGRLVLNRIFQFLIYV